MSVVSLMLHAVSHSRSMHATGRVGDHSLLILLDGSPRWNPNMLGVHGSGFRMKDWRARGPKMSRRSQVFPFWLYQADESRRPCPCIVMVGRPTGLKIYQFQNLEVWRRLNVSLFAKKGLSPTSVPQAVMIMSFS